jgi:DNA ligase (NAD+)
VSEDEVAVYCDNPACPAQLVKRIEYWVSRGAMDVVGMGTRIVEQLVEQGLVHDVADLYTLGTDDLVPLEGFAEKKAQNLVQAIQDSKAQSLDRVMTALGIRGVGTAVAQLLVERYGSLQALAGAGADDLEAIPGIGPHIAQNVNAWFGSDRNQALIDRLQNLGVRTRTGPSRTDTEQEGTVLKGLTFVITGTLSSLSRADAKTLIEHQGGRVTGAVSTKTDYLLCGENAGSKLSKAQQLGVPVIDQDTLLAMIGQD